MPRPAIPGGRRCALWLAFHLGNAGELAQAGGWLGQANRLLEHEPPDCAERGLLLLPLAIQHIVTGDPAAAGSCRRGRPGSAGTLATTTWSRWRCRSRAAPWCGWAGWARPWPRSTRPWWRWSPAALPGGGGHGLLLDAGGLPGDPGVAPGPRVDRGADGLVRQAAGDGHLLRQVPGPSRRDPAPARSLAGGGRGGQAGG